MKRSFRLYTVLTTMLALAASTASAQISNERLHELIKQAADAAQLPGGFSEPQNVTVQPGPTVGLSLDDAVKFALDRNLDIRVQRLNPQLQDIQYASAKAFYTPTLGSTFNRSNSVGTPSSQLQLSSGGKGITQDRLVYNGSVTQNVPWYGGLLTATFNNNRAESDSNNSLFNPQYNSTWQAVFTQPLLRDFKIDSQRRTLTVTKINREISDVQLTASMTNLVSNVRNAYWDFVYATMAVEVAQQSLDLADKLVQDNQTRVEVGTMAPIDVVQAQSEAATRRQNLVNAQSVMRTTELALKRLIVAGAQDSHWNAQINPTDRPDFRPEPIDIEAAVRRALSERTDLDIAKKNIQSNDVTLKFLQD